MSEAVLDRMKELVQKLNEASKAYYAQDIEIMSNYEYDKLYDELLELEKETGVTLSNSPTVNVGYEAVEELPKEAHKTPMLSLNKTKDREELRQWVLNKEAILSWKLDGLTIVLTYNEGKLAKAVTRGNGEIGEVITNNARTFQNLPLTISYKGELIIRGEAVITYSDFEKVNSRFTEEQEKYKNPRNLCSGSVRQLNSKITAERKVRFFAFSLVEAAGVDFENSRERQLLFLQNQGFETVEYKIVNKDNIIEAIGDFEEKIKSYDVPSDGLVLSFNDIAFGASLGRTAKFPRDSIAFKWADEIRETTLLDIEWSASRTGLINPVAIFEPVELEGTTVSRASVHNISIMQELELGIGDTICVYKANMIIPQIAENKTKSNSIIIPETCPVCGHRTEIRQMNDAKALYCTNEKCDAKKIKAFTLFVGRDGLNIEGLSESTLEKFINKGFLHQFTDLFHLDRYRDEIVEMEGFGEKSYQNLMASVETARKTTLPKVIYSLGIAGIGLANAKLICRHFQYNIEAIVGVDREELNLVEGIGEILSGAFCDYFAIEENRTKFYDLLKELEIEKEIIDEDSLTLNGKTFVITGSLMNFASRNELKELIEQKGGKVTGSVTGKTDCLINNDISSNSSKNKKAKELGIPIVTEEVFMREYLG